MKKIHNKGMSFIELVIAVAIFAIMIGPIVSKLIQATKTSDVAKTAQSKYEYAENVMENIKNAGAYFYDSTKVADDPYLKQVTKTGTLNVAAGKGTVGTGLNEKEYDGYVITGQANVGKKDSKYYYAIHVNNRDYAKKESEEAGSGYQNPNNVSLPAIANFDSSSLAIINGTIGNYDLTVTNAFMSKKLDILRVGDQARWEQYTKQQAAIVAFPNDSATRVIEIGVDEGTTLEEGKSKNTYTVTCKLRYKDKSTYILKDGVYKGKNLSSYLSPIEYTPYKQTFVGELPDIYLMYNPCLYNNNYMDNDYILLDTKNCGSAVPRVFVVETAEKYSSETIDGLMEVYKKQYKEEHGTNPTESVLEQIRKSYEDAYLINNEAIKERANVNVNIMTNSSTGDVEVFHNFDITDVGTNKTPISSVNKNSVVPSGDSSMTVGYSFLDASKMLPMDKSSETVNKLYSVDIYISDKPFTVTDYSSFVSKLTEDDSTHRLTIYDGKSPVVTGSKGGN